MILSVIGLTAQEKYTGDELYPDTANGNWTCCRATV